VAVASAGLYASLHLIPDNHANIPPLGFLQAGCPSCRPTNSVKALKEVIDCFILHNIQALKLQIQTYFQPAWYICIMQQQLFNGPLSMTTRVSQYRKLHSPTLTYSDHQLSFNHFLHPVRSMASCLFNLGA